MRGLCAEGGGTSLISFFFHLISMEYRRAGLSFSHGIWIPGICIYIIYSSYHFL